LIDAACLLGVDGRGEPTEVHFTEDLAVWLLAIDWASASSGSGRAAAPRLRATPTGCARRSTASRRGNCSHDGM
jgi:hypothetical protein